MTKSLILLETENLFQNDLNLLESDIEEQLSSNNYNILKTADRLVDILAETFNSTSLNLETKPTYSLEHFNEIETLNELNYKLQDDMRKERTKTYRNISYKRNINSSLSQQSATQVSLFAISELDPTYGYSLNFKSHINPKDRKLFSILGEIMQPDQTKDETITIPNTSEFSFV